MSRNGSNRKQRHLQGGRERQRIAPRLQSVPRWGGVGGTHQPDGDEQRRDFERDVPRTEKAVLKTRAVSYLTPGRAAGCAHALWFSWPSCRVRPACSRRGARRRARKGGAEDRGESGAKHDVWVEAKRGWKECDHCDADRARSTSLSTERIRHFRSASEAARGGRKVVHIRMCTYLHRVR